MFPFLQHDRCSCYHPDIFSTSSSHRRNRCLNRYSIYPTHSTWIPCLRTYFHTFRTFLSFQPNILLHIDLAVIQTLLKTNLVTFPVQTVWNIFLFRLSDVMRLLVDCWNIFLFRISDAMRLLVDWRASVSTIIQNSFIKYKIHLCTLRKPNKHGYFFHFPWPLLLCGHNILCYFSC